MTLDEIRKLIEAATLGPWHANGESVATRPGIGAGWPKNPDVVASLDDGEYIENPNADDDARFIAAARTLLPALLDVAEKAKARPFHETWCECDMCEALAALEAIKLP